MDKAQLRKNTIKELKNMPRDKKQTAEQMLTENLLKSDLWKNAKTVGITIAQGFEWDTRPIIEAAWLENKIAAVPKCIPQERKLLFYELKDFSQLEIVYYRLQEPKAEESMGISKQKIDLLVVPGIVFDKSGYRIGFGGGYYDRFLTDFSGETISLVHTNQLVDSLPSEKYDIPVRHIVTENDLIALEG